MPEPSSNLAPRPRSEPRSRPRPRSGSRSGRPAYRQRSGYDQAIVTLTDSRTRKRRDYWLGPFGSPESRERYHLVIADWEARGRRLPPAPGRPESEILTINQLLRDYWLWARGYYSRSERHCIRSALRVLRSLFGSSAAAEFGPNRLRLVRDEMVRGNPSGPHPRKPWSRRSVNAGVHRVCAVFKWAAAHEMLAASVYTQLKTVSGLRRGRTEAPDCEPVGPVSLEYIDAVRPFLSRQVKALIDLQLHTGARGGELFKLRAIDITMNDQTRIWTISPADHKTSHHGHGRTIFLGPKAQAAIQPFLADRPVDGFLLSPAEAEQERQAARAAARKTPISCGNSPGTNRVRRSAWHPGDHYTSASYRRAIERACDQAFPPPDHLRPRVGPRTKMESRTEFRARMSPEMRAELKGWRREHRWHPHQLRHTAATQIRREFGLEAARIALGHSSALITDAVYAERDMEKVVEVMRKIG